MISGKKVFLRAIESADAELYHSWINDSETNHWRGLYHPTSMKACVEWVQEHSTPAALKLSFAISISTGETVGFIGMRGICGRSNRAEIWIYLGNKLVWGQGFGSEAIRLLCLYAFQEMNLHRLWAEIDAENIGSVRCFEKNNFIQEGRLRAGYYRHGKYRDTVIVGTLKTDWGLEND